MAEILANNSEYVQESTENKNKENVEKSDRAGITQHIQEKSEDVLSVEDVVNMPIKNVDKILESDEKDFQKTSKADDKDS